MSRSDWLDLAWRLPSVDLFGGALSARRAAAALLALPILAACAAPLQPPVAGAAADAPQPAAAVPGAALDDPEWADEVLYFAIVDRFANGDLGNDVQVDRDAKGAFHGGDLAGLTAHLDEIADLGVTALWITPVAENIPGFVTGAGFPDWAYHGYWADDFERVDRRFGTESDLASLAAAAHRRGIKLLLDVVYNHAGYGSRYLTDPRTRGWFRSEQLGTCGSDDLTSCLAGLPDFRTELPVVADYLLDAHLGRAKRVGLDGFRLDTVKHVDHLFWQQHRRRTRSELGEHFFLLGEVWGGEAASLDPWFAADEMDAGFDFSFQGSTLAWVHGRGRTVAFERYLEQRHGVREGYHLAHFLSSHDVPGALHQLGGDKELFRLAAVLQLTTLGIPTIYYGEEVGRPGGDWPENRSDMPWGDRDILPGAGQPRDETLYDDYRKLITARRAHPALWRGDHTAVATDGDLLVFARRDAESGDAVVVAVNRGDAAAALRFPPPPTWASRTIRELWRDAPLALSAATVELEVPARSAAIVAANGPESSED